MERREHQGLGGWSSAKQWYRRRSEHEGHGLGHGIGLATHESPSLSRNAPADPLPSPTVFSVEPGIYLEGRYGARIEDIVVCGSAGPVTLNELGRDLAVVRG